MHHPPIYLLSGPLRGCVNPAFLRALSLSLVSRNLFDIDLNFKVSIHTSCDPDMRYEL